MKNTYKILFYYIANIYNNNLYGRAYIDSINVRKRLYKMALSATRLQRDC